MKHLLKCRLTFASLETIDQRYRSECIETIIKRSLIKAPILSSIVIRIRVNVQRGM